MRYFIAVFFGVAVTFPVALLLTRHHLPTAFTVVACAALFGVATWGQYGLQRDAARKRAQNQRGNR